jgi:hypothetical protein
MLLEGNNICTLRSSATLEAVTCTDTCVGPTYSWQNLQSLLYLSHDRQHVADQITITVRFSLHTHQLLTRSFTYTSCTSHVYKSRLLTPMVDTAPITHSINHCSMLDCLDFLVTEAIMHEQHV